MALNTAVACALLSVGILCARPDRGLMTAITSESSGGRMARQLLPAAILVPVFLGWLQLRGEALRWYPSMLGTALLVLLTVVILGGWWACAAAVRDRVASPLRTLANLLEAMREGDYSIRARGAHGEEALGDVMQRHQRQRRPG